MRKKKDKLFSKILLLFLTVMIVLGFTIPAFMDQGQDTFVEPKICLTDTDCYLMCGEDGYEPVTVLCSQNLCQQNSCEENNYYPFKSEAISFSLVVEKDGVSVDLVGSDKDIFVKFNGNIVSFYSSGLSLGHALEKANLETDFSEIYVNGEENYAFSEFVPEEGDKVKIVYD